MVQAVRIILLVGGLLTLVLAGGFATAAEWATWLWPTPDSPLSYKFVAAMQAAIAAAMIWIGLSGGLHMVVAGSLNLAVMFAGMALSLTLDRTLLGNQTIPIAIGCLVFAIFNLGLILWARQLPAPDQRPLPAGVRWSFWLFVAALFTVGILLILQVPQIMPWPLTPITSVLFGWMFFGDAFYFLYALIKPKWTNAAPQLWSFLAYDLILIAPFLGHFAKVTPELRNSLIVYIGVLLFSCAVAIYYLVLNRSTGLLARSGSNGTTIGSKGTAHGQG